MMNLNPKISYQLSWAQSYCSYSAVLEDECKARCAAEHSLRIYGSFPRFMSPSYEPLRVPFDRKPNLTRMTILTQKCALSCPHADCWSTQYVVERTVRGKLSSFDPEKAFQTFVLEASAKPVYMIKAVGVMELVVYLTNVLGCFAFWSGLTPFTIVFCQTVRVLLNRPWVPSVIVRN